MNDELNRDVENQSGDTPDASTPVTESPVKKKSWMARYIAISTVLILAACIYLGFFSDTSVVRGLAYKKTIDSLEACIQQQQDSLNYYRELNRRLSTDPSLTEQVVREQYNMKRDNEDVYVFK